MIIWPKLLGDKWKHAISICFICVASCVDRSVWLCRSCLVHLLHLTPKRCKLHPGDCERLTHPPQDPHPLTSSNRAASSPNALYLLPIAQTVCGPSTGMGAAPWGSGEGSAGEIRVSSPWKHDVGAASLQGQWSRAACWDAGHLGVARKREWAYWAGKLPLRYWWSPEWVTTWATLGILHLTCTNRTPWSSGGTQEWSPGSPVRMEQGNLQGEGGSKGAMVCQNGSIGFPLSSRGSRGMFPLPLEGWKKE